MAGLEFDFVLYLGDPDEGAEAVESRAVVQDIESLKDRIDNQGPYGALVIKQDGRPSFANKPDPVVSLVTHLLKAVPYVLDGEQESVLLSESEHGLNLVGGPDDVMVAFFAGDQFEPDEFLLPETAMPLKDFGEQMVGVGDRLRTILERAAPDLFEADASFLEFLEVASDAVKEYKLKLEHGLRGA